MWFEPAGLSSERYCGGEHHSWVRELQRLYGLSCHKVYACGKSRNEVSDETVSVTFELHSKSFLSNFWGAVHREKCQP